MQTPCYRQIYHFSRFPANRCNSIFGFGMSATTDSYPLHPFASNDFEHQWHLMHPETVSELGEGIIIFRRYSPTNVNSCGVKNRLVRLKVAIFGKRAAEIVL